MHFREIGKLVDVRAGFGRVKVVEALLLLAGRRLGRFEAMRELRLNEASVKTLFKVLRKNGYVVATPQGQVLAKRGEQFVMGLKREIDGPFEVDAKELSTGDADCVLLVKRGAGKAGDGQKLRDEAVKVGAQGASIAVVGKNGIMVPECEVSVAGFEGAMRSLLSCQEGDALLVASGSDFRFARVGCLAAALELLEG